MCDNCEWIDNTVVIKSENEKKYQHTGRERRKILDPIIIVHGYPDESVVGKGIQCDLILNAMKIMAVHGYQALLKDMSAIDVVALTVSQLEETTYTGVTSVRGAILMDNRGKVGCVSALTKLDHPILLSRRLMEEHRDVTIVQENIKGRRVSDLHHYSTIYDKNIEFYLSKIRNWGVIARDRNENLAGGRSIWSLKEDNKSSINVMMSVPGCGLLVDDISCCSVSGDDQMTYLHAPARKIIQLLKGITSTTAIKNEIDCFMKHDANAPKAVVYLGASNEPLIVSQNHCFPWAYCHRGILKYGYTNIDESFSENIVLDVSFDCRCQRLRQKNHKRK